MDESNKKDPIIPRDTAALIIGGIFVIFLVFVAYNYFNKPGTVDNKQDSNFFERILDGESTSSEERKNDDQDSFMDADKDTGAKDTIKDTANTTISNWVANDYEEGDIESGRYTVRSGDTLWEIAEAVYGNGAEWGRILNANQSSIGFLPSGQQALIVPGQVLVLP